MYFITKIKKIDKEKNVSIFVDMDGVIADYEFGDPLNFVNKRPLKRNIKVFEHLALLPNVTLNILSICHTTAQIKEKELWLSKNAPVFDILNQNIFAKEDYPGLKSKQIKLKFLKSIMNKTDDCLIVIDDDNEILEYLKKGLGDNVILFQDSSLVD